MQGILWDEKENCLGLRWSLVVGILHSPVDILPENVRVWLIKGGKPSQYFKNEKV